MTHMKLWGGRFSKATDALVDDFNSSIRFDARMYRQDIKGSMAHAEMLGRQGIIPKDDAALIVKTLGEILKDIENGKVEFSIDAEDIHMNIETILTERIGDAGKKLHTGRSRNDQVALDLRMYLRDENDELLEMLKNTMTVLLDLASAHLDTIMPGYTHFAKGPARDLCPPCNGLFSNVFQGFRQIVGLPQESERYALGLRRLSGHNLSLRPGICGGKAGI